MLVSVLGHYGTVLPVERERAFQLARFPAGEDLVEQGQQPCAITFKRLVELAVQVGAEHVVNGTW